MYKEYRIACEFASKEITLGDVRLAQMIAAPMALKHGVVVDISAKSRGKWKWLMALEPSEEVKKFRAEQRLAQEEVCP